jgi:hypothetical protein
MPVLHLDPSNTVVRPHQLHFTLTITYLYRYSTLRPLSSQLCALQLPGAAP